MTEPVIHLALPSAAATYCGEPPPADRKNGWTAWLTEATCEACLSTLRPETVAMRLYPPTYRCEADHRLGGVCHGAVVNGRCLREDQHAGWTATEEDD